MCYRPLCSAGTWTMALSTPLGTTPLTMAHSNHNSKATTRRLARMGMARRTMPTRSLRQPSTKSPWVPTSRHGKLTTMVNLNFPSAPSSNLLTMATTMYSSNSLPCNIWHVHQAKVDQPVISVLPVSHKLPVTAAWSRVSILHWSAARLGAGPAMSGQPASYLAVARKVFQTLTFRR